MRPRLLTGGRPRPPRSAARAIKRTVREHPVRAVARQVVGWTVIAVGVIGIVMPLNPAIVVIPAGVAIVGRHQWLIRFLRTRGKLLLRRAETLPGFLGALGRKAAGAERRVARLLRARRLERAARSGGDPGGAPVG